MSSCQSHDDQHLIDQLAGKKGGGRLITPCNRHVRRPIYIYDIYDIINFIFQVPSYSSIKSADVI